MRITLAIQFQNFFICYTMYPLWYELYLLSVNDKFDAKSLKLSEGNFIW